MLILSAKKECKCCQCLVQTIVDMSCGSGLFSRRFARSARFNSVIAADFSESMLGQARTFFEMDNTIDPRYQPTVLIHNMFGHCMIALQHLSRVSLLTMPQLGHREFRHAVTDIVRSMQEIHSAESRCWQITIFNVLRCWYSCWSSHTLLAQSHCSSAPPHTIPDLCITFHCSQTVQKKISGI